MQERLPIEIESETPAPIRTRPVLRGDDWRIDERTRRTGIRGLAKARAALDATRAAERSREPDAA